MHVFSLKCYCKMQPKKCTSLNISGLYCERIVLLLSLCHRACTENRSHSLSVHVVCCCCINCYLIYKPLTSLLRCSFLSLITICRVLALSFGQWLPIVLLFGSVSMSRVDRTLCFVVYTQCRAQSLCCYPFFFAYLIVVIDFHSNVEPAVIILHSLIYTVLYIFIIVNYRNDPS